MLKKSIRRPTRRASKGMGSWWYGKPSAYWFKFLLLTSGTLMVAVTSAANAVGNIARRQNPQLALSVVPSEPVALTFVADQQFLASQTSRSLDKVERMARRALRQQPLNASAVRLLGYVADARGQKARAKVLVVSAASISRREFGAQLWLIEEAVARNDTAAALRHYDVALRSTVSSHPILVSTLTAAMGDMNVRKGLAPYISQGASWVPVFLGDAVTNGSNPADTADILLRAGKLPSDEVYVTIANSLLGKLAERSMFATFRQLYVRLPGSRPVALSSVGLNRDTVALKYRVAGWAMNNHAAVGGTFSEPAENGNVTASVFAGSGERQELMRKYTFYRPGRYRFSASYNAGQTATDGQIQWDFECISKTGRTSLWRLIAPIDKGSGASRNNFVVPANCPNQQLAFGIAGGTDQTGADLILRSMSITPI